MQPGNGIGASVRRLEDRRFLVGDGLYTADLAIAGQAYMYVVRSMHAHARIHAIDVDAVRQMPGVLAVLTGDDVKADGLGPIPCQFFPEDLHQEAPASKRPPRPILAAGIVRHVGDRVACVIADTQDAARSAAEALIVEYEALPPVLTIGDALRTNAPQIWPEAPDNTCFRYELGDAAATDAAFARAHRRVSLRMTSPRVSASPLEPRNAMGQYDRREERYILHSSTQCPHRIRAQLARSVFHIDETRLTVRVLDVGGAFGLKVALFPEDALVLWAAKRVGRPVRWLPDRSESFLSDDHGRDQVTDAELALDEGGRFLALRTECSWNLGAYVASTGTVPAIFGPPMLTGAYRIPAAHVWVNGVFTNTQPTAPYRGAGRPEAIYAIERLVDHVAWQLGLDPVLLRRQNLLDAGDMPAVTPLGHVYDSGDFASLLSAATLRADVAAFPQRQAAARGRGRLRGLGVAYYVEVAAFFNERADLRLEPDGRVAITVGTVSTGQGHETMYAQLVASWLDMPMDRIRIVQGDTDRVGFGRGTFGSRSLTVGGEALHRACGVLKANMFEAASELMEVAAADLELRSGRVGVRGTDRSLTLGELAAQVYSISGAPGGRMGLDGAGVSGDGPGNFPNGCNVCELEVDPDTGQVEIIAFTAVDDVGTVVNPMLVEGQIHGGLAQGIGQAMMERIVFDDHGQLVSGSFMDYQMPRAADLPSFHVETMAVPTRSNSLGVKGAGEAGCISAPPAFVNALIDALHPLGVADFDMPATPQRVWNTIEAHRIAGMNSLQPTRG